MFGDDVRDRIEELADRLHLLLYAGTPYRTALAAVLVAWHSGDPDWAEGVLSEHYGGEEADAVYALLEEAASL